MPNKNERSVIGRGLDALLHENVVSSSINEIAVADIKPNPEQPRSYFDEEALRELADSIRSIGLVQPITVRQEGDGTFMIISGERRWRAAKLADLETIPAYVVKVSEERVMEMALIENIQREDLNAVEIALAYKQLLEQPGATQESLAQKVGKKRATISNYLRLLRLPAQVQLAIKERKIDMGHARALLSLETPKEQLEMFRRILKEGLTVRQVETEAQGKSAVQKEKGTQSKSTQMVGKNTLEGYQPLTKALSKFFGSDVKLTRKASGKGALSIAFTTEEDLIRICSLLEQIAH